MPSHHSTVALIQNYTYTVAGAVVDSNYIPYYPKSSADFLCVPQGVWHLILNCLQFKPSEIYRQCISYECCELIGYKLAKQACVVFLRKGKFDLGRLWPNRSPSPQRELGPQSYAML